MPMAAFPFRIFRRVFSRNTHRWPANLSSPSTANQNCRGMCPRGMLEYGEGLILAFWPQLRGKTVRLEELVSMELTVDKPDPDDFL